MHAAHILRKYNPAEWGGTETAVKQILDGLAQQLVRNTVYAPRTETGAKTDPIKEGGHTLKRYKAVVPVVNISKDQRNQLVAVGGNLLSFDLLGSLLREKQLSIVHTHALNRIGGIALTAARLRKLPFVATIHGGVLDLPENVQKTLSAPLEGGYEWGKIFGALFRSRHVLKEADAIITCNPREAALQQERFPEKRVVVQPHGVPIAKYQADYRSAALHAFPTVQSQKIVLVVGRIDPVKNQGWVLAQMPRILKEFPDAILVMAGACTDELYGKMLRKEVRKLGLENKVLFTGGLPPGDPRLIGLMQQASAMVVPSLSETFGLIILEAWAAKAPVISTRTSGAVSMVKDGENGILFDLQDVEQFHDGIARVFTSTAYRCELAQNGHRVAAEEYDTFHLSKRIHALYQELIQEKKRR